MNKLMSPLRISDPSREGKFSVSKWIKHQVLLDTVEMEELCRHLSPFALFNVSEILPLADLEISIEEFLRSYRRYIDTLKAGKIPHEKSFQRYMSCALSLDGEALYAQQIQPDRYMAKPIKPLVQMQQHRFYFSKMAGTINPMVMSNDSIHWGIQFSYPQIFFDSAKGVYSKVTDVDQFPNTALFTKLVKWLRSYTVPTTFMWDDKKIATPLRLGKQCFGWVASHPQLIEQGISVHVY